MIWAGPGCKGPDKREAAGDWTTAETEGNSLKREKGTKNPRNETVEAGKVSVRASRRKAALRHLDLGPVKLVLDA